jgi:hypothetical protein
MARKALYGILLAIMVVVGVGSAAAKGKGKRKWTPKAKNVRVAILPVQVKGVEVVTGNKLGTAVFRELRAIGVFRFISPKQTARVVRVLKRKKIFTPDCTDKPKCVRIVGRRLKAKVIYSLLVSKAEEGVTLSMRTFDVKSGKEVRKHSEFATEDLEDMERAVKWSTRMVSGPMVTTLAKGKGKLRINCEASGADLYLNGKNFGKRTGKSFKVSSGVFDIMVKKQGMKAYHDVVVVKPNQEQVVNAKLEPDTEVPPPLVATEGSDKGDETPPVGKTKDGKNPKDLPAWAVFDGKKEKAKPIVLNDKKTDKTTTQAGLMPWQKKEKDKPFLPGKEEEPVVVETDKSDDTAFYKTWWFWTIIGVGVAGAAGTTAYFLLATGDGDGGQGTALLTWE